MTTSFRSIARVAGSLWLSGTLLVSLLVAMVAATVFEAEHGTERALAAFYHSWWFETLLLILAVNVAATLVDRFAFSRRQSGFVLTHLAIILILCGALISNSLATGGQIVLAEGETVRDFSSFQQSLTVLDHRTASLASIDLDPSVFGGMEIVDHPPPHLVLDDARVTIVRYLADGTWVREVLEAQDPTLPPAVEISLSASGFDQPTWIVADSAGTPQAGAGVVFRPLTDAKDVDLLANNRLRQSLPPIAPLEILGTPTGELYVRFSPTAGPITTQKLEIGVPIDSSWPGWKFAVLDRLEHARVKWSFKPIQSTGEPHPGLLLEIAAQDERIEVWVAHHEPRTIAVNDAVYELLYGNKQLPLGFDLTLRRFQIRTYPGSAMPRSIESQITTVDPTTGRQMQQTVSMTQPAKVGDYTLYQSSYSEEADGTAISVLAVRSDPGQSIVFAGYSVLLLGMIVAVATRATRKQWRTKGTPTAGIRTPSAACNAAMCENP